MRYVELFKRWLPVVVICVCLSVSFSSCSKQDADKNTAEVEASLERTPVRDALVGGPYPSLLMTQAQFITFKGPDGKSKIKPGYARLVLFRNEGDIWKQVVVEDPDSNVFHKAMPFTWKGKDSILTIGANKAVLKAWTYEDNSWKADILLERTYGGKFDRLRDVEIGDVNGDGNQEIVIATHDQGVIHVGTLKPDGGYEFVSLDKKPGTFIHEIEIGDVDGDGVAEFFATPSEPNKATMVSQPGLVVMYKWDKVAGAYQRTVVDSFTESHAKEILAVDLGGKGVSTLFSVREAHTEKDGKTTRIVSPVEIRRYAFGSDGKVTQKVAATLTDRQCRFLTSGDLNGDGKMDIVAAGMKSGLWLLQEKEDQTFAASSIDAYSSGYEHASVIADLDQDGKEELYVASDDQGELRRYNYNGTGFDKTVIAPLKRGNITWNLMPATY